MSVQIMGSNSISSDGALTLSATNGITSSSLVQVAGLGVGTAPTANVGEIRATNNITAYFSDDRLKTRLGKIDSALDRVCSLSGFYYEPNQLAQSLGYQVKREVGISAQDLEKVLPEAVKPAPIDEQYKTVQYERVIPLLIEAIKELTTELRDLKSRPPWSD